MPFRFFYISTILHHICFKKRKHLFQSKQRSDQTKCLLKIYLSLFFFAGAFFAFVSASGFSFWVSFFSFVSSAGFFTAVFFAGFSTASFSSFAAAFFFGAGSSFFSSTTSSTTGSSSTGSVNFISTLLLFKIENHFTIFFRSLLYTLS